MNNLVPANSSLAGRLGSKGPGDEGLKGSVASRSPHAASPMVAATQPVVTSNATAMKVISKNRKARRVWTHKEDSALLKIVEQHVFDHNHKNHWAQIAEKLDSDRTGKQCRDRWQNHLRPDIKKGQWTKEEEHLIREMHKSFGTKWSCMAKLMKNRTDNDIKNKWYSMMRKEKKALAKREKPPESVGKTHVELPMPDLGLSSKAADAETTYEAVTYEDLGSELQTGDFYLLPTNAPVAGLGWSLNNVYGQNLAAYYNPQLVVGDFGTVETNEGVTLDGTVLIGKSVNSCFHPTGAAVMPTGPAPATEASMLPDAATQKDAKIAPSVPLGDPIAPLATEGLHGFYVSEQSKTTSFNASELHMKPSFVASEAKSTNAGPHDHALVTAPDAAGFRFTTPAVYNSNQGSTAAAVTQTSSSACDPAKGFTSM